MVGFARAFSDGGSAYLADVYVLPAHRGRGLGKAIVAMMVEDGPGAGCRWMLHTSDAYGLYRQFGFDRAGQRYMERRAAERQPPASGSQARSTHSRWSASMSAWSRSAASRARPAAPRRPPDGDAVPWFPVPQDEAPCAADVEDARSRPGTKGSAVPFAVVRMADETVIGCDPVLRARTTGPGQTASAARAGYLRDRLHLAGPRGASAPARTPR